MGTRDIHASIVKAIGVYEGTPYESIDYGYYNTLLPNTKKNEYKIKDKKIQGTEIQSKSIGGINLGNLTDYLIYIANGIMDANWQGDSNGFIGDIALDGLKADERTSGKIPYSGTIYTNDKILGSWANIVKQNSKQAKLTAKDKELIEGLEMDLVNAFKQINSLPATPGFENRSILSLDGLNTKNGKDEVYVINITSDFNFSKKINITGDKGDVFILRWDSDGDCSNGYQGQVKPQNGGAIVPLGGLKPSNFINVAGDINASGGGTNPLSPFPQGPRKNDGLGELIIDGIDFKGGGFFTGYWLTTGKPEKYDQDSGLYYGETTPINNGVFVGGWYTISNKFSIASGTSGVYVTPNTATIYRPSIEIKKFVSVDSGQSWNEASHPPGPYLNKLDELLYKFVLTNAGNVTLTDVTVNDDVIGELSHLKSLDPGTIYEWIVTVK